MAYQALDLILAEHYNTFVAGNGTFGVSDNDVANINTVWGVGYGDKGYGQGTILTQVTPGTAVSATQWQTLINRLLTADDHQDIDNLGDMPGDGGAGGAALTTGNLIEAIATMQANATSVFDNRLLSVAPVAGTAETASDTNSWDVDSVHTINVQFDSGDEARYFFNAGGQLDITASRSGGGSGEDNAAFDQLLPDINIIRFGAQGTNKIGGAGTPAIENTVFGYHDLTTSPSQIFRQYATGYAATNILVEVQGSTPDVDGNGDVGLRITFTVTMATTTTVPPGVDGTTSVTVTPNYPATTYIADAWGTITYNPASTVVQT